MSFADPLTCGFFKVAVFKLIGRYNPGDNRKTQSNLVKSESYNEMFVKLTAMFPDFKFTKDQLVKSSAKIKLLFSNLAKTGKKLDIMTEFDDFGWLNLQSKSDHSLNDCKGCLKSHRKFLRLFPINKRNKAYLKKANLAGLFDEVVVEPEEVLKISKIEENILKKAKGDIERQWTETSVIRFIVFFLYLLSWIPFSSIGKLFPDSIFTCF